MPLNGVMLMKQAGMAARRLSQLPGKWLHCSALETPAWPHSHQCSSPAQGCPGSRRKPGAAQPDKRARIQPGNEG